MVAIENGRITLRVTEDLIFDNSMDTLFDREKIKFDLTQGNYYPPIRGDRHIIVEAEDETLKHWAINALNRNHYICLSYPYPSTLYPILKLKTAREMSFLPSGGEKIPRTLVRRIDRSFKIPTLT